MFISPPPRTPMSLYPGGYFGAGIQFAYAELELTDRALRCLLTDKTGYEPWLEQRLHIPDLKQRLRAGQPVLVFEFLYGSYDIQWRKGSFGSEFNISQGGASPWRVALFRPPFTLLDYFDNGIRKQWRRALESAGSVVPAAGQSAYPSATAPQQQAAPTLPPPGWYPDPSGAAGMQRYWDGARWGPSAQPRP